MGHNQQRLIEMYREIHDKKLRFHGTSLKGRIDHIGQLITETGSKTLLDYGCGGAIFYKRDRVHEKWGVSLTLYDPAVREYDKKPEGKFDFVVCTDVLEHVAHPEAVIKELVGYADKCLYLAISTQHSAPEKRLADGTPFHICVHPEAWWMERIEPYKSQVRIETVFS